MYLIVHCFLFYVAVTLMISPQTLYLQHFREHLDKLFAQGIGMLDIALTEAFNLLSDVSSSQMHNPHPAHSYRHTLAL